MLNTDERMRKVRDFDEACLEAHFKKVAPHVFELKGSFSRTLTLCTLIHGNEIGGIEIFLKLLEEIRAKKLMVNSNLRLMLGNVDAYYEDVRFLETDMNRSFGIDEHNTLEEKRAKELEIFFHDTDVLIDIHQTIGPSSTPFFIFEFEQRSYNLARYLHQTLPIVTNTRKRAFKGKTTTGFTISKGGMGITIETGQKGIVETQVSLGLDIARKAIETDFNNTLPAQPMMNTYTFHQILNNPEGRMELVREYNNFDPVKAGEILAKDLEKEVRSEVDGIILFPKYGAYAKASMELALILKACSQLEDGEGHDTED